MLNQHIVIGAVARINLAVKNHLSISTNAVGLKLIVKAPSGFVTIYTLGADSVITQAGIGQYHANVTMTEAGHWLYRWESEAPSAGADEGRIIVKKSLMN